MLTEPALRWQCRRGMRELDVLLLGWLERHHATAGKQHKAAFERLLALPDPELAAYLLGARAAANPVDADVIRQIRTVPEA